MLEKFWQPFLYNGHSNLILGFLAHQEQSCGYTCGNGYAQTCRSVASSTSLLTGICPGGGSAINYAFKTIPFPVGSSIVANYTIQAPLFQLVYQPSDLTSTPPGFPMATAAPTSSPSSTDVQNSTIISANSTGTRLSAGAAAGIGVGGAVAVMIVAILSYLLWRSKRKSKTLPTVINSTTTPMTPYSYYSQPYEGAHTPAPSYVYSELSPEDSRKPQEFSSSTTAPVELSAADSNWVQSQAPGAQLPSELEHVSRDHQKVLGLGGIGRTAGQ
ncbi:hypothetical protein TruAng_007202 [Truncatella angustata]|nr:hypothetical protein TruAng_007202 [Truncatella angustata]